MSFTIIVFTHMSIDATKTNWALYLTYDHYTGKITSIPSHLRHPYAARGRLNLCSNVVNGVVFISITLHGDEQQISAGRLVHYLHLGIMPDREPIYINGEATDLRWENLRYRDIGFVEHTQAPTNARVRPLAPHQVVYAAHDPKDGTPIKFQQ